MFQYFPRFVSAHVKTRVLLDFKLCKFSQGRKTRGSWCFEVYHSVVSTAKHFASPPLSYVFHLITNSTNDFSSVSDDTDQKFNSLRTFKQ